MGWVTSTVRYANTSETMIQAKNACSKPQGESCMLRRERIAAVVVTYHPDELFPERIERLSTQVDSLVIVDNHSGEATVSMLRGIASCQSAKLLLNPENLGIAAALNIGVE